MSETEPASSNRLFDVMLALALAMLMIAWLAFLAFLAYRLARLGWKLIR